MRCTNGSKRKATRRGLGAAMIAAALILLSSSRPAQAYHLKKSRVPDDCEHIQTSVLVDCYLKAMPKIADAMVYAFNTNPAQKPWKDWPASMKAELRLEFDVAMKWYAPTARLFGNWSPPRPKASLARFPDPLPRGLKPEQEAGAHLTADMARRVYLSYVANSLAAEMAGAFRWSITSYSPPQLADLFWFSPMVQQKFYGGPLGLYNGWYTVGAVSPANATYAVNFMRSNGLLVDSPLLTVGNLVEWSYQLWHYFTDALDQPADPKNFWGPNAFPAPYSYIVKGTEYTGSQSGFEGIHHFTPACWGTTQFMVWTLRAVNLPTRDVPAGSAPACQHRTPYFSAIGRYLSHGDDPYVRYLRNDPPVPGWELLIDSATFNAWFPPLEDDPDGAICLAHTGHRPAEVAVEYLTDALMESYCRDVKHGKSHEEGEVFETLSYDYTLEELEAMYLWENMALKAKATGMDCAP
jgi:hypothetical protein